MQKYTEFTWKRNLKLNYQNFAKFRRQFVNNFCIRRAQIKKMSYKQLLLLCTSRK